MIRFRVWRSPKHLERIRQMPCCVCGQVPSEAHHIIGVGDGVMGSKAPDSFAMPLCTFHHRKLHDVGLGKDEQWRWLALTLAAIVEGKA